MAFIRQKFAFAHPTFGRSAKEKLSRPYTNSVYYLWWEFLRRNDDYLKCCKSGGKGKLKSLYMDFGDVFDVDFKTWWQTNDKGVSLFAEEHLPEFAIITESSQVYQNEEIIYLRVPLSLPKRYLMREFQSVLDRNHQGRAGIRTNKHSTSKYPISGHVDMDSLDKCLRVYDMKKQNPKMYLWEVAQKCKITKTKQYVLNDGSESPSVISDKKLILANTASRLLKKAEKIIAGTGSGEFPVLK